MPDSRLLGVTQSVCPHCRSLVPAKLVDVGNNLYLDKFCNIHGNKRVFVRSDTQDYLHTLRVVKPAVQPWSFSGLNDAACPSGCGFCDRHEQHLCLPIVEITQACDLACPICLVDAGGRDRLTVEEFSRIIDGILMAEPQIDILNLSGGEPLTHPDLLPIIDNALTRKQIVRVSISTNGRMLIKDYGLAAALKERDVVISLQLDGFEDRIYQTLRGLALLDEKKRILDILAEKDMATSLTMTAARDVNEHAIKPMVELLFQSPHIISLMIQPLVYDGRADRFPKPEKRLTLPDIVNLLGDSGLVLKEDFSPLPCCHPACYSLAFYLMHENSGHVPLAKLFGAQAWLDTIVNKAVFGLTQQDHERIKGLIYELWSGPAAETPDAQAVLATVRNLLKQISCASGCGFDARRVFTVGERKIKSIFIHAFMDADTFDLARARRCCTGYPQKDGKIIPVCVHNVLRRHESSE